MIDIQVLENMIRLMEGSALSGLELECEGFRVRMEKPIGPIAPRAAVSQTAAAVPVSAPVPEAQPQAAPEPESAPKARAGSKELKSPMVGTFHFIKGKEELIGKPFKKGDAVCTIEAMKLMNEITMEEDGTIAWIAASEGEMVEFGQILLTFE